MQPAVKLKLLVLVKTKPIPSKKYVEIVCTAGIREDGTWVRIFPIKFRQLPKEHQFKKYQWIECYGYKPQNDSRPESYHIDMARGLKCVGEPLDTKRKWELRRQAVLEKTKPKVYESLRELIADGKLNKVTLAVFKPTTKRLVCEKARKPEDPERYAAAMAAVMAPDLFEDNGWREDFKLCEKIPFDFKYEVTDSEGKKAKFTILDWEIGALFYHAKHTRHKTDAEAKAEVIQKYGEQFCRDDVDLHFYMGTMNESHKRHFDNPWSIIGVAEFPAIKATQMALPL